MLLNPNNCDLSRLRYKARQALWLIVHLYELAGLDFAVTHTDDGMHMEGSLHFKNRAFDGLPPEREREQILKQAKVMMGPDWDLIDEKDHWHIEYDPK